MIRSSYIIKTKNRNELFLTNIMMRFEPELYIYLSDGLNEA